MASTASSGRKNRFELTLKEVSGILPRGGTILGTTNRGDPFHYKKVENGKEVVRDISGEVIANAAKLGIDAIITIGGDGSQKIGYELFQKGMKIVGVPKTIDNDLSATQVTFGFDTALHTVTDAIDKIHTTAASHHRVMVVEVMGRDCGWIALEAGIAGGAHVILIPEIPFTIEHVCRHIAEREKTGKHFTIVVVAEGVKTAAGVEGEPPRQFDRQPDRQRHRATARQRSAGQRAGAHSARRHAFAL
jgi:ATP-dependent phosphofructokinase / diphosphate-dependent phosphofructokinase